MGAGLARPEAGIPRGCHRAGATAREASPATGSSRRNARDVDARTVALVLCYYCPAKPLNQWFSRTFCVFASFSVRQTSGFLTHSASTKYPGKCPEKAKEVPEAMPPKKPKKRGQKHPGVVLIKPDSTHLGWRIRFRDPDSDKFKKETIPDSHSATLETRATWAVKKSQEIVKRKIELEGGAARATGVDLSVAIDRYFTAHPALRPRTVEIYRRSIKKFQLWSAKSKVKTCNDVTRARMMEFRSFMENAKKRIAVPGATPGTFVAGDERLSATAINQDLRAVRTILRYLCDCDLFARLTHDDIRRALKTVSGEVGEILFLNQSQCRQLLEAAIKHDSLKYKETAAEHRRQREIATTPKFGAMAPMAAFLLLSGLRISEAIGLTWQMVDVDAGELRLPASLTKTKTGRTVLLDCCPSLWAYLRTIRPETPEPKQTVWNKTPGRCKRGQQRLLDNGAPSFFTWHVARATCGTFLTNSPGIYGGASAYQSAQRLGHSVAVAEKSYLGKVRNISRDAATLEAAMGVEDLCATIFSA